MIEKFRGFPLSKILEKGIFSGYKGFLRDIRFACEKRDFWLTLSVGLVYSFPVGLDTKRAKPLFPGKTLLLFLSLSAADLLCPISLLRNDFCLTENKEVFCLQIPFPRVVFPIGKLGDGCRAVLFCRSSTSFLRRSSLKFKECPRASRKGGEKEI